MELYKKHRHERCWKQLSILEDSVLERVSSIISGKAKIYFPNRHDPYNPNYKFLSNYISHYCWAFWIYQTRTVSDQHTWVQRYKLCGGELQSPVSISSFRSLALPLPALETIGYHDFFPGSLYLKNNGHSVVINISNNSKISRLPYIFGAALKVNQEYEIDHLHFHWGAKNNRGSEHILNGVRFPMEMHIVHRNKAYSNLSDALHYKDGLAVLGIFFQLQEEDNKSLYPVLNELTSVKWLNNEIQLKMSLMLASLLPHNTDVFYTYQGSLTTPPCNEVVTWIIFPTPVPISFTQLKQFRALSNGEDILVDNYRTLQKLGLRKIYVRRLNSLLSLQYNKTIVNVTNLDWFWH